LSSSNRHAYHPFALNRLAGSILVRNPADLAAMAAFLTGDSAIVFLPTVGYYQVGIGRANLT
jgi:hypothetical protein